MRPEFIAMRNRGIPEDANFKPQHDLDAQKQGRAWITDKGRAALENGSCDLGPYELRCQCEKCRHPLMVMPAPGLPANWERFGGR